MLFLFFSTQSVLLDGGRKLQIFWHFYLLLYALMLHTSEEFTMGKNTKNYNITLFSSKFKMYSSLCEIFFKKKLILVINFPFFMLTVQFFIHFIHAWLEAKYFHLLND